MNAYNTFVNFIETFASPMKRFSYFLRPTVIYLFFRLKDMSHIDDFNKNIAEHIWYEVVVVILYTGWVWKKYNKMSNFYVYLKVEIKFTVLKSRMLEKNRK